MKFKNQDYQRKHDELAANFKRITGKDLDKSFEEWKQAGMPKYEPSEEFKKSFEEFKKRPINPLRDEDEEIKRLKEVVANLDNNQFKEDRKKKPAKPKSKRKLVKKCKCK